MYYKQHVYIRGFGGTNPPNDPVGHEIGSRPLYVARVCRVWRCCEFVALCVCCVRPFACAYVCLCVYVCAWLDSFTYARSLLKVTSRRLLDTYGEQDSQSET